MNPLLFARRLAVVGLLASQLGVGTVAAAQSSQSLQSWQSPQFLTAVSSYRLSNGLTVVMAPDPTAFHVSVELWLAAGTRHDPRGQRGTAHLLEHVSAALAAPLDMEGRRRAAPYYANSNAQVRRDHARYFLLVDPSAVDAALATHAARLALRPEAITDSIVRAHADIVVNEGRGGEQPITDGLQPYWRLQSGTYGDAHPYGLPGETEQSVRSISAQDLRTFAATHAGIGDAVLLVVGAFNTDSVRTRIVARFGGLPARANGQPRQWRVLPTASEFRRDMQRAISGPSRLTRRFAVAPLGESALEHAEIALRIAADRWRRSASTFVRQAPRVTIEPGMLASDLTIDAELSNGDDVVSASRLLDQALLVVANGDTTGLGEAHADGTATMLGLLDALGFQRSRSEQLGEATFFAGNPAVAAQRLQRLRSTGRAEVMQGARDWLVGRGYELALVAPFAVSTAAGAETLPTDAPMLFGTAPRRTLAPTRDTTIGGVRVLITRMPTLPLVRATIVAASRDAASVTRQRAAVDSDRLWQWIASTPRERAGTTIYLTGSVEPAEATRAIARAIATWHQRRSVESRGDRSNAAPDSAPRSELAPGVQLVEAPGRVQAQLRIELRVPTATADEEIVARVFRKRLTTALNTRLRTERRWSYGANSSALVEGDSSRIVITAEVQSDRARESLQEAEAVVRAYADGASAMPSPGVLAEEMRQELLLDHSTLASVESSLRSDLTAGRTVHWRPALLTRVETMSAEDLSRARRLADWSRMTITLTGSSLSPP
ncbi:MAG: insulinase family protein [Gemmatimonadaceae bacterium]|nr:insulinase family protein [Gemmatimonadaceae bacterium]